MNAWQGRAWHAATRSMTAPGIIKLPAFTGIFHE